MEFNCECCNYITLVKSNYNKHIKSKKHIRLDTQVVRQTDHNVTQELNQIQPNGPAYCCKYCDQTFKFKQSMYRHIKYSCTKNKSEDLKELLQQMILKIESEKKKREMERKEFQKQLERQEKVFMKQLQTQSEKLEKLMRAVEIHDSFNNNTINNYTLACRETDLIHITPEDIKLILYKENQRIKKESD